MVFAHIIEYRNFVIGHSCSRFLWPLPNIHNGTTVLLRHYHSGTWTRSTCAMPSMPHQRMLFVIKPGHGCVLFVPGVIIYASEAAWYATQNARITSKDTALWLRYNTAIQWALCLYSLSGKTSYRKMSWSLEAARLDVIMIAPLWNLTGSAAAEGHLKLQSDWKVLPWISRLREFTRSCGKTSYH